MRTTAAFLLVLVAVPLFALTPDLTEITPKSFPVRGPERYLSIGGSRIDVNTLFVITGPAGTFPLNPLTVTTRPSLVDGYLREFAQVWIPTEVTHTIGLYRVVASNDGGAQSNAVYFEVTGGAAPQLYLPPMPVIAEATGPDGAIVQYPIVSNVADVTCTHPPGSQFPLGTTEVSCTAHDYNAGTSTTRSFTVNVTDRTPPELTIPSEILVEATGPDGAIVTFETHATDIVDGEVYVQCSPASASKFPIGTTMVMCSATDSHYNSTVRGFNVTVVNNAYPMLMLPDDITTEATSAAGAIVEYTATAHDQVDGAITPSCTPPSGSTFPISTTTVTCTATSSQGKTASGTFDVTVVDANPPVIATVTANPNRLWPVNHKLVDVTIDVTFTDDTSATWKVVEVLVNEPAPAGDWKITADDMVALRVTRNSDKSQRVYTIVVEVTDLSGNRSRGSVDVIVPHDNSDGGSTVTVPSKKRSARRG